MAGSDVSGLVTDATTALLHLRCSHPVDACEDCILLSGPESPEVLSFQPLREAAHSFEIRIGWEEGYRGPVTLDLEASRYAANSDTAVLTRPLS